MKNIRNFSIIAHINHGKSTLSDRLIQHCNGLSEREMKDQVLDTMELEREKGITIKSQSVTLNYKHLNNQIYQLNFIDTPGHVDFSYEVSRSLAACEGALLIIDSSQGIEAQTLSNFYIAKKMQLKILPVLNKIDLPSSNTIRVINEIKEIVKLDTDKIVSCSAKYGTGVQELLIKLVDCIPPPNGSCSNALQALIIDSWFNNYLGVVSLIRIKNGILKQGDKIKLINDKKMYSVEKLGIFTPKRVEKKMLYCGEVGWVICGMKNIYGAPVGGTFTLIKNSSVISLPGFKKIKPQVYASLFPLNSDQYKLFHNALKKLSLNDSSLYYEQELSSSLGMGFRCGFLGLLHMEIVQERLKREYRIDLMSTIPTVVYEIITKNNNIIYVDNPSKLPLLQDIIEFREPIAECKIFTPKNFVGKIIDLCIKKRGIQTKIFYYENQVLLCYNIPMNEIIIDFFDQIKSCSSGYASLDYKFKKFKNSKIVRIDILVNKEKINPLSLMSHKDSAYLKSKVIVKKMINFIPRKQFDICIQAAVNNSIIFKSVIKKLRKNVLEKCHGGDISRKKKLLKKQKKGKKRMKETGNVLISKKIFLEVLSINNKFK